MNLEKAREFFSSYYEETLEPGLRQSFEQKLRTDEALRAEYRAFEFTMSELDTLKFEEIPVPVYLNARICARLDDALAPKDTRRGLVFYLPRFGIAAAAAAAIAATAFTIPHFGENRVSSSPMIPPVSSVQIWPSESISVTPQGKGAQLHYSSATGRKITISDDRGNELKSFDLSPGQSISADLSNPNKAATIFLVQVSEGGPQAIVAVAGFGLAHSPGDGRGSVSEFAKALADQYGTPVIVSAGLKDQSLVWNFNHVDEKTAADQALEGSSLEAVQTSTGSLSIKGK